MLGPSQLHSSERASRPAAHTAHRAQQPGEIRWDGSKKAELAGGLVLAGHYYSQSYFMAPVNWPGSARRSHAGRRMAHSDNHSCSCDKVPNKLVDDKMLEAMLAMFVLAQRPSVKYGKHFSSNHDVLCFKL